MPYSLFSIVDNYNEIAEKRKNVSFLQEKHISVRSFSSTTLFCIHIKAIIHSTAAVAVQYYENAFIFIQRKRPHEKNTQHISYEGIHAINYTLVYVAFVFGVDVYLLILLSTV